jgi:quercetin dioxygenase-like cupin family protein
MAGVFVPKDKVVREAPDWGKMGWVSRPSDTGATKLTVIEVVLTPGGGHDFHKHPDQEEVIYVIEGTIEQWLQKEKKDLVAGDSAFIPADAVHASFNVSNKPAKLLAILGPCVGEGGYEIVDVSGEAPWSGLR